MPKDTFFNLVEEKKQRIIDIALEEFAIHDYRTASLSRIVEKAGIAKGSMYQYFENKKDLYFYLIDMVANEKLTFLSKALDPSITDFFDMYKQMIFVGAKFDLSHPHYSRLLYNAGLEGYNEELGHMGNNLLNRSSQFLKQFIIHAQQRGQVRDDMDLELIAFIISRLSVEIGEYISGKFKFSYPQIIKEGGRELPITEKELEGVLDDLIEFFRGGLKK